MSFVDLGLKPELLRALSEKGYQAPTPIQSQAIPAILAGTDVLAGAQTGTGKTAAFVLPILQRLIEQPAGVAPRALILTPTRELAAQVLDSARWYGRHTQVRSEAVFGGVNINPQITAMRAGCDLLVATPGRLLDLLGQGVLGLSAIRYFVLDEADRMLDMGFIHDIRRVVKLLPAPRQNLLFSATYAEPIRALAARILRNPAVIEVAPRNAAADRVEQQVFHVARERKRDLLAHLINTGNWHQVLVFTRTKHGANRLAQQLAAAGIQTAAIHGNKSQAARVRALADFKALKVTALIATEVAARGLDIKDLPYVVNYELPNVPEDYVHRIGRTARAGGAGSAISLVASEETAQLRDIERLLRRRLPEAALPQFAPLGQVQPSRGTAEGRHGEARHGEARHGEARHGEARHGDARHEAGRRHHAPARHPQPRRARDARAPQGYSKVQRAR
ncbi:MAG: DEAD/DEAH box helicase [Sinobacteraceae bacterium]|nr:DEAD/DEAH box helicase [Nevskiaceae bacterium]